MDLGARGWQTLRFVTLPLTATALVSGALLAFGLSFDEVIVTVFTAGAQNTLPLWIFGAIRLGQQLPEVNAVVSIIILLTIVPVILAARLAGVLPRVLGKELPALTAPPCKPIRDSARGAIAQGAPKRCPPDENNARGDLLIDKHQFDVGSLEACRAWVRSVAAADGDPELQHTDYECGVGYLRNFGDIRVYRLTIR